MNSRSSVTGKYGNGVEFDGSNDEITVAHSNALDVNAFTRDDLVH